MCSPELIDTDVMFSVSKYVQDVLDRLIPEDETTIFQSKYFRLISIFDCQTKTNFYITDIQNDGHRIYYFRQDIWHKVSDIEIEVSICDMIATGTNTTTLPQRKPAFLLFLLFKNRIGIGPLRRNRSHINDSLEIKKN
ncbi:hypothetical protein G9A89_008178 [Geosiphon pyriformis]|nr:hypothetical protein G9A89_008178 [Geosiphon pyriformis]